MAEELAVSPAVVDIGLDRASMLRGKERRADLHALSDRR
jgi:hypothetical protein